LTRPSLPLMVIKDELHRAQKLPADICCIPTILKNNFFQKKLASYEAY